MLKEVSEISKQQQKENLVRTDNISLSTEIPLNAPSAIIEYSRLPCNSK